MSVGFLTVTVYHGHGSLVIMESHCHKIDVSLFCPECMNSLNYSSRLAKREGQIQGPPLAGTQITYFIWKLNIQIILIRESIFMKLKKKKKVCGHFYYFKFYFHFYYTYFLETDKFCEYFFLIFVYCSKPKLMMFLSEII